MRTYTHKIPPFVKGLYPNRIWDVNTSNKNVFLTFDDGPHPEATHFVLEELDKFDAKATFFCVGENVRNHRELVDSILSYGHAIGNHTDNHLNGRKTKCSVYIENVNECNHSLESFEMVKGPKLFRPPYGRLTAQQYELLKANYSIIMWDYLVGDFDLSLPAQKCLNRVIADIREGSIVVFHDSQKAFETLKAVLPTYLETLYEMGFESKSITQKELVCEV